MTQDLTRVVQDNLAAARAGIEDARAQIKQAEDRIESLNGEIGDLMATLRVLERLTSKADLQAAQDRLEGKVPGSDAAKTPLVCPRDNPFKPQTNKWFMWEVLDKAATPWLTANDVQSGTSALREVDIPMSSISPALSEMKSDGHIERDGLRVALRCRVHENEAPNGQPAGASEAGEPELSPTDRQSLAFWAAAAV